MSIVNTLTIDQDKRAAIIDGTLDEPESVAAFMAFQLQELCQSMIEAMQEEVEGDLDGRKHEYLCDLNERMSLAECVFEATGTTGKAFSNAWWERQRKALGLE